MTYLTHAIKLPLGIESKDYVKIVSEFVGIDGENIHKLTLRKRSIDARDKSQIRIVCSFVFDCDYEPKHNCDYYTPKSNILNEVEKTKTPQKIIVIGSGPAGLFSALYLSKAGHNVIIIERGEDVTERKATVDKFFVCGQFNDKSNVQFGLGGAGTFSDGKLTSGISSPYINTVFEEFNALGAPDDIMYSNTPHIGTDYLTSVVDNMRREIENYGGQFL
ncbi:MAG: FAD-dependent oxidoreductase, partial [Clostridia bacterium]